MAAKGGSSYDIAAPGGGFITVPSNASPDQVEQIKADYAAGKQSGMTAGVKYTSTNAQNASAAPAASAVAKNPTDQILADVEAGKKVGQEFIPDKSLGRVSEDVPGQMSDIIAQRKAQLSNPQLQQENDSIQSTINGLGKGLSSDEMQGYRDQAARQINLQTQTQMRSLKSQQSANGVNGASAVAQQMQAQMAGNNMRADFERQLFLQQRSAIQQDQAQQAQLRAEQAGIRNEQASRLGSLETTTETALSNQQANVRFNLQQAAQERFGQLSTALGIAGLGVAERGGAQAAAAAAAAGNVKSEGGLLSNLLGGIF